MFRDFLNVEDDLPESFEAAARPKADRCELSAVDGLPLGMTYAPMQVFRKIYTPEEALGKGTLFCELDLPFRGGQVR